MIHVKINVIFVLLLLVSMVAVAANPDTYHVLEVQLQSSVCDSCEFEWKDWCDEKCPYIGEVTDVDGDVLEIGSSVKPYGISVSNVVYVGKEADFEVEYGGLTQRLTKLGVGEWYRLDTGAEFRFIDVWTGHVESETEVDDVGELEREIINLEVVPKSTRALFTWTSAVDDIRELEYGVVEDGYSKSVTASVYMTSPLRTYKLELLELEPDTKYYYRIMVNGKYVQGFFTTLSGKKPKYDMRYLSEIFLDENGEFDAYLVVSDSATDKEVAVGNAMVDLFKHIYTYPIDASNYSMRYIKRFDVSDVELYDAIVVGLPCSNAIIRNQLDILDCKNYFRPDEGILKLHYNPHVDTYNLLISAYDLESLERLLQVYWTHVRSADHGTSVAWLRNIMGPSDLETKVPGRMIYTDMVVGDDSFEKEEVQVMENVSQLREEVVVESEPEVVVGKVEVQEDAITKLINWFKRLFGVE